MNKKSKKNDLVCESCGEPAIGFDLEGVPLCAECLRNLSDEAEFYGIDVDGDLYYK